MFSFKRLAWTGRSIRAPWHLASNLSASCSMCKSLWKDWEHLKIPGSSGIISASPRRSVCRPTKCGRKRSGVVMRCSWAKTWKNMGCRDAKCMWMFHVRPWFNSTVFPTGDLPRHPGLPTHWGCACNVSHVNEFTTWVPGVRRAMSWTWMWASFIKASAMLRDLLFLKIENDLSLRFMNMACLWSIQIHANLCISFLADSCHSWVKMKAKAERFPFRFERDLLHWWVRWRLTAIGQDLDQEIQENS